MMANTWTPEPWREPHHLAGSTLAIGRNDYQRARACVNACAGIADPETTISELVEALQNLLALISWGDLQVTHTNKGQTQADIDKARAALAKLDKEGAQQG